MHGIPQVVFECWEREQFWGSGGALDHFWIWYTRNFQDQELDGKTALISAKLHYEAAKKGYEKFLATRKRNYIERFWWWATKYREAFDAANFGDIAFRSHIDGPSLSQDELKLLCEIFRYYKREDRARQVECILNKHT